MPTAAAGIASAAPVICKSLTKFSGAIGFSGRLLTTMPPWHENGKADAAGYCGAAGDAGAAPSRLRGSRGSERAVAGRRGSGAKPAGGGCFASVKSNVAGFEYQ